MSPEGLFLLVLLTQNPAGDINASFVNADTEKACEASLLLTREIFVSRNITILHGSCFASPLRFTPFAHSVSTRVKRYHYYILPSDEGVEVIGLEDREACRRRLPSPRKGYCATSTQRMQE